mmetsp:Transcript_36786/g.113491  ORF Transcript_36786/g.113491 Transcript_36786/m.113491 type:complete len:328 (-) Transcript_36786:18-1001(-)
MLLEPMHERAEPRRHRDSEHLVLAQLAHQHVHVAVALAECVLQQRDHLRLVRAERHQRRQRLAHALADRDALVVRRDVADAARLDLRFMVVENREARRVRADERAERPEVLAADDGLVHVWVATVRLFRDQLERDRAAARVELRILQELEGVLRQEFALRRANRREPQAVQAELDRARRRGEHEALLDDLAAAADGANEEGLPVHLHIRIPGEARVVVAHEVGRVQQHAHEPGRQQRRGGGRAGWGAPVVARREARAVGDDGGGAEREDAAEDRRVVDDGDDEVRRDGRPARARARHRDVRRLARRRRRGGGGCCRSAVGHSIPRCQ